MNKIKSIFHTQRDSIQFCKDLNLTHFNLTLWTYPTATYAFDVFNEIHNSNLHCIISDSVFSDNHYNLYDFLKLVSCKDCIVYLEDEPNLNYVSPKTLRNLTKMLNKENWKTMIVLSWIKSYRGYENCADYIGFNLYETSFFKRLKLYLKIKLFQLKNKSHIIAVPAVKQNLMVNQFNWWNKWIKPDGYFWYQFYPQQEVPPWERFDISKFNETELKESFK